MKDKGSKNPPSMLSALLRHRAIASVGSQVAYADTIGVNEQTMSRWVRGITDPTRSKGGDKLAEDLGVPVEHIQILGGISVAEGCGIVLDKIKNEKEDPEVVAIEARFMALIEERGPAIPSTAFVVYITGDTETRKSVVDVLEQYGDRLEADIGIDSLGIIMELNQQGSSTES